VALLLKLHRRGLLRLPEIDQWFAEFFWSREHQIQAVKNSGPQEKTSSKNAKL
jgi:hypothetical protein